MLIYLIAIILSILLLFLSKKTNNTNLKRICIALSFLSIFVVSALRYNVGSDYLTYEKWFNKINSLSFKYADFAFVNLIFFIKLFTNNSQFLFVVTSFIILFFIFVSAFRYKDDYDLIIFLFLSLGFYFSTFNGIRQWIAASIFMYSFKYIEEKKFIKYAILVFCSSLFHMSALLLIPCYFIFSHNYKDKTKIILLSILIVFSKVVNPYQLLAVIFKIFLPLYYQRYVVGNFSINQNHGTFMPVLLNGGMLVYYYIFKSRFLKIYSVQKYEKKKNMAFILTIFAILNTINYIFSRISAIYFIPMIIFLIPDVYKIFGVKIQKVIKLIIIVVGLLYITINTTVKNSNDVLPYKTIFDNNNLIINNAKVVK